MNYSYAVKTSAGSSPAMARMVVPGARQREALKAVLDTIKPETLAIPRRILALIPPRAYGYDGGTAEHFSKRTSPDFDPIGAATIAADLAISALLNPQRAARLNQFNSLDQSNPDFSEVVSALLAATWSAKPHTDAFEAAVAMAIGKLTVTRLIELGANTEADGSVRAVAIEQLKRLHARLGREIGRQNAVHRSAVRSEIERFLNRPEVQHKLTPALPTPAGDPIGSAN
ncbi:MAG: zinc-dependent metalloprotease [Acidobacteriota bacterium]